MIESETSCDADETMGELTSHLITSIVLAGGKGTRLGKDKLQEVVGGRPLLQRVIDSLSPISERILVVTAQGQKRPAIQATQSKAASVPDIYPGRGALVSVAPGFDVVMPRIDGEIEPLHAVYSRDCLPAIQEQIERNQLQIRIFLERVRVRYVELAEIDVFDPRHLSFFNVNTPEDLTKAEEIASQNRAR
jgi:molybdopterin-guanine dinucleotide biosynthesis protein A